MGTGQPLRKRLRLRFLEALLQGDDGEAGLAVGESLQNGLKPKDVLLEIIGPVQEELGTLWEHGRASVVQEHLGTQISLGQMDKLRQEMRPKSRLGVSVAVATVEGEQHWLGARILADLLVSDGWEVRFLGTSVPARDLSAFVEAWRPELVVLSVTMPECLPALHSTIQTLLAQRPRPKLIVGGKAVEGLLPEDWKEFPDKVACDPQQLVADARQLVGLKSGRRSLETFLKSLGQRLQSMRKAEGWSQQILAERSGLDRTYISAAEHGKQNLTLGAVMKLADALDVPIEKLLGDEK